MSAEPVESALSNGGAEPYEVIHLGGEAAAVVPLHDLRRLRALERAATPEALDHAAAAAAAAELDEWEAAGRPGAKSHEEFMAELFGDI
ncbi:MAG TPA: hypothetical protein VFU43_21005 [Streptosporangiaceae bacterium]|nr:hypothetical protein [Streptosporangiaceae bacterium]